MMRYTFEVKADIGSLVSVKNWAQIFYDVNKRCRISSQEGVTSLVCHIKLDPCMFLARLEQSLTPMLLTESTLV